jgi:MoaA/NifB/PqqE/SkfB family radical SAM enzyme
VTESNVIDIRVEPAIRPTGDSRELGIMVSAIRVLPAHRPGLAQKWCEIDPAPENLALNEAEWASGETLLASFPPHLRIDLEARCNIKPPCVYCEFEYVKGREALSDHSFQPGTLIEMGSFFRHAETVLDCSIGEPLMSRHFEALAIIMAAFGKRFDFTTNGQLLNKRLQEVVLGRNMVVCVSLEAVTAELYSLYRNEKFDVVIDNLSKLCRRKREHGNLPTVVVAYLAMRSNVGTFEKFVDLMTELGVDAIRIRNLNLSAGMEGKEIVRNGRRFVYRDEVLSLTELKAFVGTARAYTQKKGMEFHADLDLGEFRAHPSQVPICDEPWKTLYFFKRGIFPCCFGHRSLFRADDRGNLPLEEFLWQVWNSKPFQEIRFHLAQGRPAPYCMDSSGCPVVQKRLR